jgi:hypothetical protein
MSRRALTRLVFSLVAASIWAVQVGGRDALGATPFFYQYVGPGENAVRSGVTHDGLSVESHGVDLVSWQAPGSAMSYGDPVFSRLASGRWVMTAWSSPEDPRGAGFLLYHEADCPQVDDSAVIAVGPSSGAGCLPRSQVVMAKTSQVFEADGVNYVFMMNGGEIYIAHLSDAGHGALGLESLCLRQSPPATLGALQWGEVTRVIDAAAAGGLLLSDTAVARRTDGTWVLFVKGIPSSVGCSGGTLCELCNRSVYRATSRDLLSWSSLVPVVEQASIPEAAVSPDGSVWLYWQDFSDTCEAQDLRRAARAPISAAYEGPDGQLVAPMTVSFPGEAFEGDPSLHYATNANPVGLGDAEAAEALDACLGSAPTCTAIPRTGCRRPVAALGARFRITRNGDDVKDRIDWKWTSGEEVLLSEIADATAGRDYDFCLFDESGAAPVRLLAARAEGGRACGTRPCWRASARGMRYSDRAATSDGLTSVRVTAGVEGLAKAQVKGRGALLGLPALPLGLPVRVQLQAEGGICWEAAFDAGNALRNDATQFLGRGD